MKKLKPTKRMRETSKRLYGTKRNPIKTFTPIELKANVVGMNIQQSYK